MVKNGETSVFPVVKNGRMFVRREQSFSPHDNRVPVLKNGKMFVRIEYLRENEKSDSRVKEWGLSFPW